MTASICEPTCVPARRVSERDGQLLVAACRALARCGHRALAQVECAVRDGVVVLSGEVPTYYLKQIAQTAVLRLPAADCVENQIDVSYRR